MKYNLRTLKGKRIVGGDPNLATKNEIHVTKIPEQLGIEGGETESSKEYYYLFNCSKYINDNNITDEDIKNGALLELTIFMSNAEFMLRDIDHDGHYYTHNMTASSANGSEYLTSAYFWKNIKGMSIRDSYVGMSVTSKDGDYIVNSGNIFERTIKYVKIWSGKEDAAIALIDKINPYITEVTKEEYESYIDVPITIL